MIEKEAIAQGLYKAQLYNGVNNPSCLVFVYGTKPFLQTLALFFEPKRLSLLPRESYCINDFLFIKRIEV